MNSSNGDNLMDQIAMREGNEGDSLIVENPLGDDRLNIIKHDAQPQFFKRFSDTTRGGVFIVVHVSAW